MNYFQFLRDYQDLQHTIMFDNLIDLPFGRIGYCEGDKSAFWWNFTERLTVVSEELFSVGLFPVTIFLGTKLFPAAFIYLLTASYPAQALLENRLPQIIILQLFFIFLLNIVVNFFQKQGIKKYTS